MTAHRYPPDLIVQLPVAYREIPSSLRPRVWARSESAKSSLVTQPFVKLTSQKGGWGGAQRPRPTLGKRQPYGALSGSFGSNRTGASYVRYQPFVVMPDEALSAPSENSTVTPSYTRMSSTA